MKLLMLMVIPLMFIGCSTGGLTIAKCDKYENGICINASTEKLKECKEPLIQDGVTYCH
jgi:hypothetical protein